MNTKNNQRGFIVQGVIAIVALVLIGGGAYWVGTNRSVTSQAGCIKYVGGFVGVRNECTTISQCDYYKQGNRKYEENSCYFGVATSNKDILQCDFISEDWMKKGCMDRINYEINVSSPVPAAQPSITIISPNGGERILYSDIVMAGDLGFKWKTSLDSSYFPSTSFSALIIDENENLIRNDRINSKLNLGNGIFSSTFVGESKISLNKKYKIKVCDLVSGKQVCDESDNYFTITLANTSFKITPEILPDVLVDMPNQRSDAAYYNQKLTVTGSMTTGLKWEIVKGSLPQGLFLQKTSIVCIPEDQSCNSNKETFQASISGRVQTPGTYNFTVRASNGMQSVEKAYTLVAKTVSAIPSITLISPNGGEVWKIGTNQEIKWTPISGSVDIVARGCFNNQCTAKSEPLIIMSQQDASVGHYKWKIPEIKSGLFLISVCQDTNNTSNIKVCDMTDSQFTITN